MPRFLLSVIVFVFLGTAAPSNAGVYPNGGISLFSGLAHTAFKRFDVPFPGWVQPDFRPLTRDRGRFAKFLNEIRGFFLSNRSDKFAGQQAGVSKGNANFDTSTILPIRIGGSATIGNTIDIFIGVNLTRFLTQVFASVFRFKEEFVIDSREQETRPFGGGGGFSRSSKGRSTGRTWFSTLNHGGFHNWTTSQHTFATAGGQQQLLTTPNPVDDQPERHFRVWRKRIAGAMTNPVVIFCIVIAAMVSFAWRISRASS